MKATIMYGAGDVRVENVPDATVKQSTDALVRVTRACICGSDLWPYHDLEPSKSGRPMGHEANGVVEAAGVDVRKTKKGDFVIMPFAFSDGTCAFCHEGLQTFYGNITISGGPAPTRAYIPDLLSDVLEGRIDPGRVFDRTIGINEVPDGYRAMDKREAIKVMIKP